MTHARAQGACLAIEMQGACLAIEGGRRRSDPAACLHLKDGHRLVNVSAGPHAPGGVCTHTVERGREGGREREIEPLAPSAVSIEEGQEEADRGGLRRGRSGTDRSTGCCSHSSACPLSVVVDENPYSMPPRTPISLGTQNSLGSIASCEGNQRVRRSGVAVKDVTRRSKSVARRARPTRGGEPPGALSP